MRSKFDKKIFFTIFTAVTISGFIIICTLGQNLHRQKVESKLEAAASDKPAPLYTVMSDENEICIYRRGSSRPYMVLDFDPMLLSDYDREQLRQGVDIYSDSELRIYIDDISS